MRGGRARPYKTSAYLLIYWTIAYDRTFPCKRIVDFWLEMGGLVAELVVVHLHGERVLVLVKE